MTDAALDREAIAIFERSLEVDAGLRAAWIVAQTAGRSVLHGRVQSLVDADRLATLRTGGAADTIEEELPLDCVGAYRITGQIGRGGMGTVYRGERMTGDFHHVVAIKVIKPGLLSEALVDRFLAERQTLAQLSHANIAQLFDGGQTEAGSPYIVMEFVDGFPILNWAEEGSVSREHRLRLFADICRAVAFAHRSLIVHRDLTPSNVLVTRDGMVKLIDFGIAKVADSTIGEAGSSIATLSLTPGYAAPERLTSANVTTAADIFSLGRLLEKLIVPAKGERELKAIIARATAPDPEDRYATAQALGDDVAAWAAGLPVAAVAGGRRYTAMKFVRRHRVAVAIAAVTTIMLVAALLFAISALARAERARKAEAARFAELRSLAGYMLFDLNGRLSRVVGNADARIGLAAQAQAYLSALAASADADPSLRVEAARGFIALALIQGVPTQPNLGQIERARANLLSAARMAGDVSGTDAVAIKGESLALLAMIDAHADSNPAAAAARLREADAAISQVPSSQRTKLWHIARSQLRRSQLELAVLQQKPDDLLRLASLIESEVGEWPLSLRQSRAAAIDLAYASHYRGLNRYFVDRPVEGVTLLQDAQRRFSQIDRALPNDPMVLSMMAYNAYVGFGTASGEQSLNREADVFLMQARETIDRLRAVEPKDRQVMAMSGTIRAAEAQSLSAKKRHSEAIKVQNEVIALYQNLAVTGKGTALGRLALANVTMGNIARSAENRGLACQSYGKALDQIDVLTERKEIQGFLANYRAKVRFNLARCNSGAPISQMVEL